MRTQIHKAVFFFKWSDISALSCTFCFFILILIFDCYINVHRQTSIQDEWICLPMNIMGIVDVTIFLQQPFCCFLSHCFLHSCFLSHCFLHSCFLSHCFLHSCFFSQVAQFFFSHLSFFSHFFSHFCFLSQPCFCGHCALSAVAELMKIAMMAILIRFFIVVLN